MEKMEKKHEQLKQWRNEKINKKRKIGLEKNWEMKIKF